MGAPIDGTAAESNRASWPASDGGGLREGRPAYDNEAPAYDNAKSLLSDLTEHRDASADAAPRDHAMGARRPFPQAPEPLFHDKHVFKPATRLV